MTNLLPKVIGILSLPHTEARKKFPVGKVRQRTQGISSTGYMPMRDDESGRSETAGSQLTNEGHQWREIRVDEESASGAQHCVCVRGES